MYPKASMKHVQRDLNELLTKNIDRLNLVQTNVDATEGKDRETWKTVAEYYVYANRAITDVIISISRLEAIYGPMLDLIYPNEEKEEV